MRPGCGVAAAKRHFVTARKPSLTGRAVTMREKDVVREQRNKEHDWRLLLSWVVCWFPSGFLEFFSS